MIKKKNPLYLVNPEIIFRSKTTSIREEGCLSLPGHFAEVERPSECHIDYIDYNGNKKILKAEGLLSTCVQHEVDHLNGILFIDYLSKLKRDMIIKKLKKNKQNKKKLFYKLNGFKNYIHGNPRFCCSNFKFYYLILSIVFLQFILKIPKKVIVDKK